MNKTKKLIFDAAIKAFSRKGFHKSTMDEIAEIAGVAKGTLYYHFKSKEDIFKFIIDEEIKLIVDEIKNRTQYISNPREKLEAICKIQLVLVTDYFEFFKTMFSQMWGDEERQNQLREALSKYFKIIGEYIKEAAEEGHIDKERTELIPYNFFGMMASIIVYSLLHSDNDIDTVIHSFVDFAMNGMIQR
ncbi:TetR/AcrR family transcriptional regulator [Caloramator sp. E03]|uniref:TetR/AcrR family transcriptional regulator n=1 Tax=Caloramator sp. E03 TaxID=2576307 RepID=UPI0011105762|nr:TetR/AcrR family transcriptional regulator [Caloramator sp. E03]QCX33062.1 TetR/AcrR family transcriptional regulator [Caloramator sp. E03]